MATNTYVALQTITLGSAAASVTFSSIPSNFRDLICVVTGQAASNASFGARFNGDSTGHYRFVRYQGDGSSVSNGESTTLTYALAGRISGSFESSQIFQVMDYSANDKQKTVLARGNGDFVRSNVAVWPSTAVITSMQVFPDSWNFDAGVTVSLYGIEA